MQTLPTILWLALEVTLNAAEPPIAQTATAAESVLAPAAQPAAVARASTTFPRLWSGHRLRQFVYDSMT